MADDWNNEDNASWNADFALAILRRADEVHPLVARKATDFFLETDWGIDARDEVRIAFELLRLTDDAPGIIDLRGEANGMLEWHLDQAITEAKAAEAIPEEKEDRFSPSTSFVSPTLEKGPAVDSLEEMSAPNGPPPPPAKPQESPERNARSLPHQ